MARQESETVSEAHGRVEGEDCILPQSSDNG